MTSQPQTKTFLQRLKTAQAPLHRRLDRAFLLITQHTEEKEEFGQRSRTQFVLFRNKYKWSLFTADISVRERHPNVITLRENNKYVKELTIFRLNQMFSLMDSL